MWITEHTTNSSSCSRLSAGSESFWSAIVESQETEKVIADMSSLKNFLNLELGIYEDIT